MINLHPNMIVERWVESFMIIIYHVSRCLTCFSYVIVIKTKPMITPRQGSESLTLINRDILVYPSVKCKYG